MCCFIFLQPNLMSLCYFATRANNFCSPSERTLEWTLEVRQTHTWTHTHTLLMNSCETNYEGKFMSITSPSQHGCVCLLPMETDSKVVCGRAHTCASLLEHVWSCQVECTILCMAAQALQGMYGRIMAAGQVYLQPDWWRYHWGGTSTCSMSQQPISWLTGIRCVWKLQRVFEMTLVVQRLSRAQVSEPCDVPSPPLCLTKQAKVGSFPWTNQRLETCLCWQIKRT